LRVKLKIIKTLTKGKKIKKIRMKIIKIIHHQLGLEAEIKNNKTFIKWLRKNSIGIRIKLKIPIHDKKKLNM
jgi:hypothetical protein